MFLMAPKKETIRGRGARMGVNFLCVCEGLSWPAKRKGAQGRTERGGTLREMNLDRSPEKNTKKGGDWEQREQKRGHSTSMGKSYRKEARKPVCLWLASTLEQKAQGNRYLQVWTIRGDVGGQGKVMLWLIAGEPEKREMIDGFF